MHLSDLPFHRWSLDPAFWTPIREWLVDLMDSIYRINLKLSRVFSYAFADTPVGTSVFLPSGPRTASGLGRWICTGGNSKPEKDDGE